MWIQELWRYPVKSMAGERIERAEVTEAGIVGDRMVLVVGPGGRIITSRTHPRLLGLRASLAPGGEPLVNGRPGMTPRSRRRSGPRRVRRPAWSATTAPNGSTSCRS